MSRRDVFKLAWSNLNRMRARVALTAIGVIIGTAAVIILISLGVGLQDSAERELGDLGDLTTIQLFGGETLGPGQATEERALDERALDDIAALPEVVAVTPIVGLQGRVELAMGRDSTGAFVQGIDPRAVEDLEWSVLAGTPRLGRGQLLIGRRVLDNMGSAASPGRRVRESQDFGTTEPPDPEQLVKRSVTLKLLKFDDEGKEIRRSERMRIAGVLESENEAGNVYISLAQADDFNRWYSGTRRSPRDPFNQALVKVASREDVDPVQDELEAMGFTFFSFSQILEGLGRVFLIMQAVLGGVGAIALLVAAFGIANTMTMAIYERTKEIGIMKAIGATNNDVLQIFLSEAAVIGLLGGTLGVAIGWGTGWLVDLFIRSQVLADSSGEMPDFHIVVTPVWLMVFALTFATLIGLISGVYPALRAANLKPLRALRTD